jgi:hypothetical protein
VTDNHLSGDDADRPILDGQTCQQRSGTAAASGVNASNKGAKLTHAASGNDGASLAMVLQTQVRRQVDR